MNAITYHAPGDLRVEQVPDPTLQEPTDALVAVELAAICGSDLHVWHGRETGLDPGTVMGHEFVGRVVATGSAVSRFRTGQRVVSPFTTSCGACFYCRLGLTARCERGQLFGWVERGRGLHGGQAALVRVPLADSTLFALPAELPAQAGILLGDVLATGHHCARLAEAGPGSSCAVIGCGPVGLMAILAARELGAEPVFALDQVAGRLAHAARLGAVPLDPSSGDAVDRIRQATGGHGADAALEAVGSPEAGKLAFELVRPGGIVAVVGVHHEAGFAFSPAQAYDKNLTYRIGRCPARSYMEGLLPLALRRAADLGELFTDLVPLERGPEAYRRFADRAAGCIKVGVLPA
ncbi:MAG TPA: alcohol dehydrogenase family protein [Gemmatimonadales bacterium]|nr:alcohol dehydrogenase family protein [Gemmatimonadales bacterium]